MLDADEREIFCYLKGWKNQFISAREICRRAGGKMRYRESPDWARPALSRMVERGILETERGDYYRIKAAEKRTQPQKWISPQIAKILKDGGKDPGEAITVDHPDEYYENL